ncbi:carbon-nitrogen hydrolase family protein [Spirosoma humi]
MKIAVAQIKPFKGRVAANIELHKQAIQLAIAHKVDALFFPELSLTGYEPKLAEDLATTPDDARFDGFQMLSDAHKLTIGLGMPIRSSAGIHLSMIFFQAGQPRQTYSKQQLHADELPYFIPGQKQLILTVGDTNIAPAICYESLQTDHARNAYKLGAGMYVASVAKSQPGIAKAMAHYSAQATQFSMPVLMSNCVGSCDDFVSAGQSAIWTKSGTLAKQLDDVGEGLLIFDSETEAVLEQRL